MCEKQQNRKSEKLHKTLTSIAKPLNHLQHQYIILYPAYFLTIFDSPETALEPHPTSSLILYKENPNY